jgi:glutathione peroxidase
VLHSETQGVTPIYLPTNMLRLSTSAALVVLIVSFTSCGSPPANTGNGGGDTSNAEMSSNNADESKAVEAPAIAQPAAAQPASAASVYDLAANTLEGQPAELSTYRGKVTLVVNVASECGYTRQYEGLQKLHGELESRGFAVLGFPSNEFGGQEPGSPAEIREFCTSKFGVKFPMFAKVETKGDKQSPLYATLSEATGKKPGWNFCKYLVGKNGEVLGFYPSSVAPDSAELRKAIEGALQ